MKPDPNQKNSQKNNSDSAPIKTTLDRKRPIDKTYTPPDSSHTTDGKGGKSDKITGRSTTSNSGGSGNGDKLPPYLGKQFSSVPDPASKVPLYAVRNQKVVILTEKQFKQLESKELQVGALTGKGSLHIEKILVSINESFSRRVISTDCPEFDENGNRIFTVLLDYKEKTSVKFPELRLVDSKNKLHPLPQANNYLVVSFNSGDPNNPPARPPVSTSVPLNMQPSDFRPLAPGDKDYYQKHCGHDKSPAVAVLDTGLKFNLHNQHEENKWPDRHMYKDANGQKRWFRLAYQDGSTTDCDSTLKGNHLGYCALQAYRQSDFRKQMKLLSTMKGPYKAFDVMNSPFDDCVVFKDPTGSMDIKNIKDARHGTSITAIIQQNGDDAPVLPVKAFDNLGYATLFDVLNAFNYILHRSKKSNIRVVNTSWIFGKDEPLLKNKISQLMKAGVFVIAAAGNRNQTPNPDIKAVQWYPACYSEELLNVITVTSVRETHFSPDTLSPKEDTFIDHVVSAVDKIGLGKVVDVVDDIVEAVLPVRGYAAFENYSTQFVNVGVVCSLRGYFQSPFHKSLPIIGSSFACAFVSGFVIRQLRTRADLLALVESGDWVNARKELFEAMGDTDPNLAQEYVAGGHYLSGHEADDSPVK